MLILKKVLVLTKKSCKFYHYDENENC